MSYWDFSFLLYPLPIQNTPAIFFNGGELLRPVVAADAFLTHMPEFHRERDILKNRLPAAYFAKECG
jgi:hypothetical protein